MRNRPKKRRQNSMGSRYDDSTAEKSVDWVSRGAKIAIMALGLSLALLICATNFPQMKILKDKQAELRQVQDQEAQTLLVKREYISKAEALGHDGDQEVQEAYARDILDFAKPGETIIRIERGD